MKPAPRFSLHTGMQGQQVLKIASLHGEFVDGLVGKHPAEHGIGGFRQRRLFIDFHDFRDGTRYKLKIDLDIVRDFYLNMIAEHAFEFWSFRPYGVDPRLDVWIDVVSVVVGFENLLHVSPQIFNSDLGTRNGAAGRVRDLAADPSTIGLRVHQRRNETH